MKFSVQKKNIIIIWQMFMIGIIIYTMKIPRTDLPVYWFAYALFAIVLAFPAAAAYSSKTIIRSPALTCTRIVWILIAIVGTFVYLFTAKAEDGWRELIWLMGFPVVISVLCYCSVRKGWHNSLLMVFVIISVLVALFGVYESVTGNIINKTPGSYYYRRNWLGFALPNTIFYNINDSAIFMTMSLFISWIYASDKKNKKVLQAFFLFVYGFNVLMVGSYGSLLAIVLFLLLQFISADNNRSRRTNRLLVFCACVVFAFSIVLASGLISTDTYEAIKEEGRLTIWGHTLSSASISPVFGVGPSKVAELNMANYPGSTAQVHNIFLEMWANYGAVGGILFIGWYLTLFRNARKEGKTNYSCRIVYNTLISFFPLSIVCSSLLNRSWSLCFFAFLVMQINYAYNCRKDPIKTIRSVVSL